MTLLFVCLRTGRCGKASEPQKQQSETTGTNTHGDTVADRSFVCFVSRALLLMTSGGHTCGGPTPQRVYEGDFLRYRTADGKTVTP